MVNQRGAGPARNGGAAASRGEILAFIDSDCRADAAWLAEGMRALERCDIAGGSVEVLVNDPERMTSVEAFERIFAFNMERYVKEKGFVGSGNLFCRRTVFDAVGPFGTGVSEDVDWSHRATAKSFVSATRRWPGSAIRRGATGPNSSANGSASIWRPMVLSCGGASAG